MCIKKCGIFFRVTPYPSPYPHISYKGRSPHTSDNRHLQSGQIKKKTKHKRGKRGGRNRSNHNNKKEQSILQEEQDDTVKIFNLSSYTLSDIETKVLSKGLSFCPTTGANNFELFMDLHSFTRKLTLQRHFNIHAEPITAECNIIQQTDINSTPPPIHSKLRPKSTFYPVHSKGNYIETFYDLVATEFRGIKNTQDNRSKSNITKSERYTINNLAKNDNIVIKSADKGGGIVILDKIQYLDEANRILADTNYYKALDHNPLKTHIASYSDLIITAYSDGVLNKKEFDFLNIKDPVMPIFYFLPKVHKDPKKTPGRPIIAGIDSLTSRLSHYVDLYLQKYVIKLPSYLKDTSSVILAVKDIEWSSEYLWATLDVASLYLNIPHDSGIAAVRHFLSTDEAMPESQKYFILEGIRYILKHNTFEFNDQVFIQTRGTVMGSRFAPSFANLYVGLFESLFILNDHRWTNNIVQYRRYIDDLLFIWKGTKEEFSLFNDYLNDNNWGLVLSGSISHSHIDYLDITLFNEGKKICTKNFFKKVDSNNFLEFDSCHNKNWIKNIPFGQMRRIKRNCTKQTDFKEQSKVLIKKFSDKKYPKTIIKAAYKKAEKLTQDQCIEPKPKPDLSKKDNKPFKYAFITRYNKDHNVIRQIMSKYCFILKKNPFLEKSLASKPCVIYRRSKNLKNTLAPSQLKTTLSKNSSENNKKPGSFMCKHNKCKCCQIIANGVSQIKSYTTNESFNIEHKLNCGPSNLIYVINCTCGLQYVGKTSQTLRMRMNNHRFNILNGYNKHSVSRHASIHHNCDIKDFTITPIETISSTNRNMAKTLSRREMF